MKKISIVGFGRFGKTLHRLLKDDFAITLYNRSEIETDALEFTKNTVITKNISEIYDSEVIFYAIPISDFEQLISSHIKYVRSQHLLIDVLSVKLYPARVFGKYLKNTKTQALLTHPMFGPDSSKEGFKGLPIVLDQFKTEEKTYTFWKEYFKRKQLKVIEMSAKEHDKIAANSQGLTHFIGRLLEDLKFKASPIDTLGVKKLLQVKEQTCNDTWQLFVDLQHYNPYTKQMRLKLGAAYDNAYNKLLPKHTNPRFVTYGIQGGKGSFNEQAIHDYVKRHDITNYKIKFLYTTEKVLKELHKGTVDYGQFAIHNSVGGIVTESIHAMARYKFKIVEEFAIPIEHFLMKRKDVARKDLKVIMAHDQVFKQCIDTLKKKYPQFPLQTGKGDLIDTAKAASYLAAGKLPLNIAILGPRTLSSMYGLQIIDRSLQDSKNNLTSFLLVAR
jgi:prephenate dehydrogenase